MATVPACRYALGFIGKRLQYAGPKGPLVPLYVMTLVIAIGFLGQAVWPGGMDRSPRLPPQ